jgi:hypothetical protein
VIPKNLQKAFKGTGGNKKYIPPESKEEKMERIMKQLGIEKHGNGKRKKKNKKKGGKRK